MGKKEITAMFKRAGNTINKYSPEIMLGFGLTAFASTVIFAVKATPKAVQLMENRKEELEVEKLPPVEVVKTTWKCYVPAAVTGTLSVGCILGSYSVNMKRNAALSTAYMISETALKEYKDKVIETIGEMKEEAIRDSIAKDKLENNPVTVSEVIVTGKGKSLLYDPVSSRYFEYDLDLLQKAVNELNLKFTHGEMYQSVNELYWLMGLKPWEGMGDELGWNVDVAPIHIGLRYAAADDGRPCAVMDYNIKPRYDYDNLHG